MISSITQRLDKSERAEDRNISIGSFWTNKVPDSKQVDVATRIVTADNRLSSITSNLENIVSVATGVFSISRDLDEIEIKPEKSDTREVSRVDTPSQTEGGLLLAIIAAVGVMLTELFLKINKLFMKMFDDVSKCINDSINTITSSISSVIGIRFDSKQTDTSSKQSSQKETIVRDVKDNELKNINLTANELSSSGQQNMNKPSVVQVSPEKEADIKKIEATSSQNDMGAGQSIEYSENGDIQLDTPNRQDAGATSVSRSKGPTGTSRVSRLPNRPLGELPPVRPLTAKEIEGVQLKDDPANPVTLHGVDPDIISAFKRIEQDVGAKLTITGTVDDHRRVRGPDTRHDSGTALDIGYSRSPILQSEAGRTLVLKAAMKEGISGVGFESDHMHIDIAAIKTKNKRLRSNWGLSSEQKQIVSDTNAGHMPIVITPQTSRSNKKQSATSGGWWQSIESYFGADEPSQGNQHHTGT